MCQCRRDYEVGYGKPPVQTRFRQGQSGNPKGRPKHSLNLDTLIKKELAEIIMVREGDKPLRVSKKQAMVKSLANKTLKGDVRAMLVIVGLLQRQEGLQAPTAAALSADEQEVLRQLEQRLSRNANKEDE